MYPEYDSETEARKEGSVHVSMYVAMQCWTILLNEYCTEMYCDACTEIQKIILQHVQQCETHNSIHLFTTTHTHYYTVTLL